MPTGYPALIDSMRPFGSRQIRNMATLGGNLCNASPGADAAPPLLVYEATVELRDRNGTREMPLEDFFVGPGETALRPGEVMTAILLPPPHGDVRSVYLRKGRVKMDVATASVAALVEMDGGTCVRARLAAGAVAPVPKRLIATERQVAGFPLDDAVLERASAEAADEISPITDVRSTAEYRRHLTRVLVRRALERLRTAEARERSPPMRTAVAFELNGHDVSVEVDAHRSLLDVLRDVLGETGTKEGCGEGECGACTVLVDDVAVVSCLFPVCEAEGASVTTVEGLFAPGGDLSPVQRAYLEFGGTQCGFCTPGMVMASVALLAENPDPSEDEIRYALLGNLCRCTGYVQIVESVRAAAELMMEGSQR